MVEVKSIPQEAAPARAGRREWVGLAALTVPMMFVLLDNGIIFLALPHLTESLGASSTEALWIADIYGFFLMGFLVTMGRIGDRIGHRKLVLIGAAAFRVLSVVAAFSNSALMLIVMRALLGVAGGIIGPCFFAIIRQMFPDRKQMATAMSIFATAAMVGVSLGPTVGGLLLNWFWSGSVFLIAVPVMLWLLAVGPLVLPETHHRSSGPVDLASVLLWLAAILPVVYGLTTLARFGWSVPTVAIIVAGLVFGVVFVVRQRRVASPLLNQHLQLVEGYSAFATALWMVLPIGMAILGVHVSTILAKRIRPGLVLTGGLVLAAVGTTVLTQMSAVGGLVTLMVGLCVVMFGTSPVGVLSNQLVMQAAPPSQAGSAGSLTGTGGELSSAMGIAIFGSLVTVFYSGHVHTSAPISPADAATANDSIAHAVNLAQRLPSGSGADLLAAARHTFNAA